MTQLAVAGAGAAGARNRWLPAPIPSASAIRLLCFPYAGGGTGTFRRWMQDLPEWIGVVPVLPPGREARTWEAPYTRVEPLVGALTAAITEDPALLHDQPYALFGHSLGALVAFETARALRRLAVPRQYICSSPLGSRRTSPIRGGGCMICRPISSRISYALSAGCRQQRSRTRQSWTGCCRWCGPT